MIARLPSRLEGPQSSSFGLTFAGRLLIAPALALILAGWLQGGIAALCASFLASAFGLSAIASLLHLRGLRVGSPPPAQGEVGGLLELVLPLENRSHRLGAAAIRFDAGRERREAHGATAQVNWLAPGERGDTAVRTRVAHRGRAETLTVLASSAFPLGLVRRIHEYRLPVDLLGLPRSGRLTWREAQGFAALQRRDGGRPQRGQEELDGIRAWRPGDSLRQIHWRRSASREELVLREYRGVATPPLEILLDTGAKPGRSFERAIQIAATLVQRALRIERMCLLRIGVSSTPLELSGPGALLLGQSHLALVQARPEKESPALDPLLFQLKSEGRRVALVFASGRGKFDDEIARNTRDVQVFDADSRELSRGLHAEAQAGFEEEVRLG